MEVYKFKYIDNGDILLEKVILDDTNYTIINKHNGDKLLKKIYKIINDGTKIIKNTILNIKTIKKIDDGYCYIEDLGISVQGVESNKRLLKIVNQCIKNGISIIMKIKLNDETNININF